ncbi:MAG TPA: NYN domain-containing protein [Gemmatimonadaceae bacterium]|nr:NYN domain-containing protein [Gemmatimonadaceae bacterium]
MRPVSRAQTALVHRGPQAVNLQQGVASIHAPNAALLIDFDNVTMGIRSDLGKELRSLLSSEIIKGKVAVQRAYADWRRYPQYIVPLSESSIDLIFAPAYGSSKKNATDIRLAIDALELVFTRPEIGTFILLSGDSDFSSLVIKLKEYGKYVIGVGIRESSSDLLVQNCDEYYSYNALAGLVKNTDQDETQKWDPWELVKEAVGRMKKNGDVMRSDRLKQVMQEIDASFDEKDLGMSKFSRFVQEAASKGLLSVSKLENGQLEIDLPTGGVVPAAAPAARTEAPSAAPAGDGAGEEGRPRRGRRGRGGRGRDREERGPRPEGAAATAAAPQPTERPERESAPAPTPATRTPTPAVSDTIGVSGERLTRQEAFDLVRRTVGAMAKGDNAIRASAIRTKARELLGRDSESLSDRMFVRVLKDAHDNGVIDLRRRGDDFEVAPAAEAESVADQLAKAAAATAPQITAPSTPQPRVGMGPRGAGRSRGRLGAPPAELLSIGVVHHAAPAPEAVTVEEEAPAAPTRGRKTAAKKKAAPKAPANGEAPAPAKRAKAAGAPKARAKKTAARSAT